MFKSYESYFILIRKIHHLNSKIQHCFKSSILESSVDRVWQTNLVKIHKEKKKWKSSSLWPFLFISRGKIKKFSKTEKSQCSLTIYKNHTIWLKVKLHPRIVITPYPPFFYSQPTYKFFTIFSQFWIAENCHDDKKLPRFCIINFLNHLFYFVCSFFFFFKLHFSISLHQYSCTLNFFFFIFNSVSYVGKIQVEKKKKRISCISFKRILGRQKEPLSIYQ